MKRLWFGVMAALLLGTSSAWSETVLKVVPHADLKNIDPIWTTAYITRNHGYMVYDTLFALD
ncbi:MAG: ABC transporter substrate-binding protein, partial [Alphaproteobacteria bacterium]|nr:ABC transporter substrate-binding protein [Alphaproteobacteria bacterium]